MPYLHEANARGLRLISYGTDQDAPDSGYVLIYAKSGKVYCIDDGGTIYDLTATGSGGSGEANTASNVGVGGVGVFKQKVGVDLQFKNINAASSKITVVDDTANDEIDIDVVESNIDHDALQNYVAAEHIDWSDTGPEDIHVDRVPDLPASRITSGQLALARGGSGADLSATGPGHVVQASSGAAFSAKKDNYNATTAPTVNDDSSAGYGVDSRWLDTTNDKAYICLDDSVGAAVWKEITATGGSSGLPTADYDSGWFAVTTFSSYTKSHGLGTIPRLWILLWGSSSTPTSYVRAVTVYIGSAYKGYMGKADSTDIRIRTQDHTMDDNYAGSSSGGYMKILAWK